MLKAVPAEDALAKRIPIPTIIVGEPKVTLFIRAFIDDCLKPPPPERGLVFVQLEDEPTSYRSDIELARFSNPSKNKIAIYIPYSVSASLYLLITPKTFGTSHFLGNAI